MIGQLGFGLGFFDRGRFCAARFVDEGAEGGFCGGCVEGAEGLEIGDGCARE